MNNTAPSPAIQNVVSTFDTGQKFDLALLAMRCCFVQYKPMKFAAAVMRLVDPQTTCLLFESGKAVCTGAASEQFACTACLRFVLLLKNNGYPKTSFKNFMVQNIVAVSHCPFKLDLFHLADCVSGFCSYEPTLFPGLVYRVRIGIVDSRSAHASRRMSSANEIVFVCFQSGRCIITGAKQRHHIAEAWTKFYSSVLLLYATKLDTGSSARYNIFDNADLPLREDDTFLFLSSITGSAARLIQSAVDKHECNDIDPLEILRQSYVYTDVLELQGLPAAAPESVEVLDDTGAMDAINFVRNMRKLNSCQLDAWILPEMRHAKRLRVHVLQRGFYEDPESNTECEFAPISVYKSTCT